MGWNSIYKDIVKEQNIVDIMTSIKIAKGLFEDFSYLKSIKGVEYLPKRLVAGDYHLFFEIKDGGLLNIGL